MGRKVVAHNSNSDFPLDTTEMYRVDQPSKLENCRCLFETKNVDRFLIKWYFYYCKGGKLQISLEETLPGQALKTSVEIQPTFGQLMVVSELE